MKTYLLWTSINYRQNRYPQFIKGIEVNTYGFKLIVVEIVTEHLITTFTLNTWFQKYKIGLNKIKQSNKTYTPLY